MLLDLCKIERVWGMRGFARKGQADGGYTTTERDLDEGRNASDIKKSRWKGKKKMKENENRTLANNIWGVVVFKHMGL